MEINIIVDNDRCWLLNTIRRSILILKNKNIQINHIWVLPEKLSNMKGHKIPFWYLRIFGIIVFLKLVLFHLLVLLLNFFRGINSFERLAKVHKIKYSYIKSLKDKRLLDDLKNKKKKYNLVFTNHIIHSKLLKLKNNFFINKHSSLLPAFGGLLPFIWVTIFKFSNGISIHLVGKKLDSGKILFQKKFFHKFKSMIEFYLYVYEKFPEYLIQSIYNLDKKRFFEPKYKKSIFTIPNKEEYKKFLDCGGKIIHINDFFNINKIIK
jgi:hypothetical protein